MILESKPLPTPEEILRELPLDDKIAQMVLEHREAIKRILRGEDDRMIMIAGPCSAWPNEAVLEYAESVARIAEEVRDKILLVFRGYIQKPRTTVGWTGPLIYPDPYGEADIAAGIRYCRKMLIEVAKLGLPIADEMLFLNNLGHFEGLLSYVAVGARNTESAVHRGFASALDIPTGMKNPTSGNLVIGINSVMAAQTPQSFPHNHLQIDTSGNSYAHFISRGGLLDDGQVVTNYSTAQLEEANRIMIGRMVKNPGTIVDGSHDHCRDPQTGKKDHRRQVDVVRSTLDSMEASAVVAGHFKGWMLEAFLEEGAQDATKIPRDQLVYGKSITDPCLGLEQFRALAYSTYDRLGRVNRNRKVA
jgi:3-deoxy-7-phosphoheptulonate synthase